MDRQLDREGCDILLINPCYHRRSDSGIIPPIGLAYITSVLRQKRFISKVLDCSLYFDSLDSITIERLKIWLIGELISAKPKLAIGIGPCTTSAIRSIVAIADMCNQVYPHLPLIYGGPLTLIPNQEQLFFMRLNAFAVVKGDGEYSLCKILSKLRKGDLSLEIPGVQTQECIATNPCFIDDLDILPHPSWDIYEMSSYKPSIRRDLFEYPFAPIIGSRGCPHGCEFCISGQLIKYRKHSFEYIIKQMRYLYKNQSIKSIIFYDDNLFPNKTTVNEEIETFLGSLAKAKLKISWQIEIRPDVFSQISMDNFNNLFLNGCQQINIGIDKVIPSKLFSKSFNIDQFAETCNSVSKLRPRIRLTGTFILGGPGENLVSIKEAIDVSTDFGLLFAHYYPLEIYPGTPIYEKIYGNNMNAWFDIIINDRLPWGEVIYYNDEISSTELINWVHHAYRHFYGRNEWKELANYYLGIHYNSIITAVNSWQVDRFRLGIAGGL